MPDDDRMRTQLRNARRIAVLGANDTPGRPSDRVGRYLLAQGYEVVPVHPARPVVWGLPAVRRLADLPAPADIIDLFRAAQYCPEHAKEVLALPWRPSVFWMQSGIRSGEARRLLADSGILVVEDACLMVEHARLFGPARTL